MNTAHNVDVLTRQKGLQRHKTQEKRGCTCRKTQWCVSDQMAVVSIRWIHTCIRKSFLTIWCSCRNSKLRTSTNTHTMNQSAKKFTSACTQAYFETTRKKTWWCQFKQEPSNIFYIFGGIIPVAWSNTGSIWVFSDVLVSTWWWPTQKRAETCSWFKQF
jgi:hypothetical protein